MATVCLADCASFDLTPMPAGGCALNSRNRKIKAFGFYMCNETIPAPMTCGALEPLVTGGTLVWTSPLANVAIEDPTFEDITLSDCLPSTRYTTGRKITAEDRIAIEIPSQPGPPIVPANPLADYDFWANKQQANLSMRLLIMYCDGNIENPVDAKGNPIQVALTVFRSVANQGSGDSMIALEVKKIELKFQDDPLGFGNEIFDASACTFV